MSSRLCFVSVLTLAFMLGSMSPFTYAQLIEQPGIVLSNQLILSAVEEARRSIQTAVNDTVAALFARDNAAGSVYANLVKLVRFPAADARNVAQAAEVYEYTLSLIEQHVREGYVFNISDGFSYQEVLSPLQLELIANTSGCLNHRRTPNCSDISFYSKYRTFDGTCNNLLQPLWGSSFTPFKRLLKPNYENGFNLPVGWSPNVLRNGFVPPNARLVSTRLMSTSEVTPDQEFTHMLMQWGQFLDHDLDLAIPGMSTESFGEFANCQSSCIKSAPCFPIEIPPEDPRISGHRCMEFIRNSAVCGSGASSVFWDVLMPREQINQLTSYIDASQIYGSTEDEAHNLRDMLNNKGRLREGPTSRQGGPLLPFHDPSFPVDCKRDRRESDVECFLAGDVRANEQLGLLAMHTLWFREHNRIADELRMINPHWDSDTIYHEARKLIGAQMQFITYEHWLPLILGKKGMALLGQYQGYNPLVDASISNVFATAAFRMGHGLIQPIVLRLNASYQPIPEGYLRLEEAFFSPWRLVEQGGMDPIMRGLFYGPAKLKLSHQILNSNLTENLFRPTHRVALDLAAINIQRGRDHGLPSYNDWRELCNISKANSFDELKEEIPDRAVRVKLQQLYGHPDNIDAWVGGMLEEPVEGAKLGPTFLCLIADQFRRLRDGDRFWFASAGVFTTEQLAQIKRASLGRVICDNSDSIREVPTDVFRLSQGNPQFTECSQLPAMDLKDWEDCALGSSRIETNSDKLEEKRTVPQHHSLEAAQELYRTTNEVSGSTVELRSNFLSNATQTDKRQPSNLNEEMEERPGSVNHKQGGGYEKQFQHLKVVISRLERMVQQIAHKLETYENVCLIKLKDP